MPGKHCTRVVYCQIVFRCGVPSSAQQPAETCARRVRKPVFIHAAGGCAGGLRTIEGLQAIKGLARAALPFSRVDLHRCSALLDSAPLSSAPLGMIELSLA